MCMLTEVWCTRPLERERSDKCTTEKWSLYGINILRLILMIFLFIAYEKLAREIKPKLSISQFYYQIYHISLAKLSHL